MITFRLGLVFLHCVVFLQLSGCTSQDESLNPPAEVHTTDNQTKTDEHLLESYDDDMSVEYEDYPIVAFSTKPKDSSVTTVKGQEKGRGRKKNLCLRKKYRNYCVHGVCQYLADLNRTSCTCNAGYSGDRCHLFILPVGRDAEGKSHTTALAVMAVILSLICLTVIGILLALRCQKKADSCMDEKIRLQPLQSDKGKAKVANQRFIGHDGYHLETSCQC